IVLSIPIRFGIETQAWDTVCEQGCSTLYQWKKRLAVVGQYSYRGAWIDFQAGLHAVTLPFDTDWQVDTVELEFTGQTGRLYIWGISLVVDQP
ncbi:MAG: hypothetical protein OEZ02_07760, partial [Anaerolineae bacterium]|nr:hypothetical protein [Anaerolineae bacterium]